MDFFESAAEKLSNAAVDTSRGATPAVQIAVGWRGTAYH